MVYERGIGSMTEEEKAEAMALVFQNGLGSETEEKTKRGSKISKALKGEKRGAPSAKVSAGKK